MHRPAPSAPRRSAATAIGWIVAGAFIVGLVAHRVHLVATSAVNVPFWDQWDFYTPLFQEQGPWAWFMHQHGPHRQGLGALLTGGLAQLTAWDLRGDALISLATTIASAALGVLLARRCGIGGPASAALIFALTLTTRQYELWVGPANPAHSPLPVLLLLLYAWAWFIAAPGRRLAVQASLVGLMIFTGFGIFGGAVGTALLLLEATTLWRERNRATALRATLALAVVVAAWIVFFHGYVWEPAEPNFHFPHDRPWEYVGFIVMMFSSYAGWKNPLTLTLPLGSVLLLAVSAVAVLHGRRLFDRTVSDRRVHLALFALAATTLLFCLNTAVGRIGLGWRAGGYPSRYVAMLVPGLLAVYLTLQRGPRRNWRHATTVAFALLAVWNGLLPSSGDRRAIDGFRRSREAWRDVYLQTGSQAEADRASIAVNGYPIYPGDVGARLDYLRQHRLSLFSAEPATANEPEARPTP